MTQSESDAVHAPQRPSALSPLRYPVFRNVWAASTLANLGGLIQSVGASWLMISIAQSTEMVALVQASLSLPVVLLSLIAGAMADNFDRRKMMLGAQLFMLVVSVALMVCAWTGVITPWLLLLFTLPDRMRRGVQCAGVAGVRRRHGAARGVAGRGGSQQHGIQYCAQRGACHRRRHRCGRGSRRRVRGECGRAISR